MKGNQQISRDRAADLGQQTVAILNAKSYRTARGTLVDISMQIEKSVTETVSYPPDKPLPTVERSNKQTQYHVTSDTTLVAGRRLSGQGLRVAALNFASAKHPGGGFLTGARAQEESLARSSGLYACISGNAMYEFHRSLSDPMYTNYAIYSPDVPVIRTDEGELLEEPWACSFITSPAVNAKAVLDRSGRRGRIQAAMKERIHKVLTVAAAHHHDTLILGAWGCGAFGNDTQEIAGLFQDALSGAFSGVFVRVVFAITDWSPERKFIGPFEKLFGNRA